MDYLRQLLESAGEPVSALELASAGGRGVLVEGGGTPLDRRAVAEVQTRIDEIEAEVDACAARGAAPSVTVASELDHCRAYLARRGGGLASALDRARPAVTKAIDRAISAIADAHELLGHHLARHVETGRTCVYVPDPSNPVHYEF
jgi:hypothetical protein